MKTSVKEMTDKLTSLLKPRYIYALDLPQVEVQQTLCVVLLEEGDPDLSDEMLAISGMVFREKYGIVLRIYSLSYAHRMVREGNLFFMATCHGENQVYRHPEQHTPAPGEGMNREEALAAAKRNYDSEMTRVRAFREGGVFYREKENYPQAAFMLHQSIELGFRFAELLLIGKEKVCHRIETHRKYIKDFMEELYTLFHPKDDADQALLSLLDRAYNQARYGKDYDVSAEDLEHIGIKADKLLALVEQLFRSRLHAYGPEIQQEEEKHEEEEHREETRDTDTDTDGQDLEFLQKRIKALIQKRFYRPEDHPDRLCYRTGFQVYGLGDILSPISSLLKVCIAALEYGCNGHSDLIPRLDVDVQITLELILQLLPYDEMGCLGHLLEHDMETEVPVC